MMIAPQEGAPRTPSTTTVAAPADVTALLPDRDALLDRLVEFSVLADRWPTSLLVIGLVHPDDDGAPPAAGLLVAVAGLLARSLRGDDWLARSGPAELAVHVAGPTGSARTAATRVLAGIGRLDVPELCAAAGIAAVDSDRPAAEVLRRAEGCLARAHAIGPAQVVADSR